MLAGGAFLLLVLLLAVGVPLALWAAIESETADDRVMDRDAAERAARGDTHETGPRRSRTGADRDREDDPWS